ncbi:MAG: uridine kinase [Bacteroidales bacterium]|nr:uridine kinase [Bacteroidales bacterium]MBQ7532419.1 uridine kinase [Bacteroidales bacterium]MCR5037640.1 uridine kinase [Bacteroidales bacterium]
MLLIGIAGGSGSGKTTVVKKLMEALPEDSISVVSQDAYYWDNGSLSPEAKKEINFDHPDAIEWDLLVKHLDMLKEGKTIPMPIYTYVTCARSQEVIPVKPTEVVIVEGILIMTCPELVKRLDIKIFVDTDGDDRLMRIIRRDIEERGRTVSDVLRHYETFVKPMHNQFIEPTKRLADIIIPQGGSNQVAIDIVASRIRMQLSQMKNGQ